MELEEDNFVSNKLNITVRKDKLDDIGLLGNMFRDICSVIGKLRKLNFTDVELSLLSAIVLFCPGKHVCLFFSLLINEYINISPPFKNPGTAGRKSD
jgi:hypothetical protein